MNNLTSSINYKGNSQMKKADSKPACVFLRNIPRGVKDHFKAYCAKRGITMTDKIVDMMREAIKKDNKLET